MDLKKVKPSNNVKDVTGYTERDRLIDSLLTRLNPLYAYRNIRESLLEDGTIAPPKRKINYLLKKKLGPESQHVEDRTGIPKTPDLMRRILFEQYRRALPPGELLKTQDHRYMQVDPILNIAHDPFKR